MSHSVLSGDLHSKDIKCLRWIRELYLLWFSQPGLLRPVLKSTSSTFSRPGARQLLKSFVISVFDQAYHPPVSKYLYPCSQPVGYQLEHCRWSAGVWFMQFPFCLSSVVATFCLPGPRSIRSSASRGDQVRAPFICSTVRSPGHFPNVQWVSITSPPPRAAVRPFWMKESCIHLWMLKFTSFHLVYSWVEFAYYILLLVNIILKMNVWVCAVLYTVNDEYTNRHICSISKTFILVIS